MKNMRKLFAMVLAIVMVLSLATTAFAATTGTVKNATDRTYKAYQIFKGTQADNSDVLGDIEWGDGIDSAAFLDELKKLDAFANCETAADVAGVLKTFNDKDDNAKAFANLAEKYVKGNGVEVKANETATLDSGYYLLVDQTDVSTGHVAKNPALLQVTNGNLTITEKADKPTVEKTVNDTDLNIGDKVTFTLTATMPSTFEGYDSYKVVFHDTMSKGLTYVENSIVVPTGFETNIVKNADGTTTITITNNNVLAQNVAAGSTITVTYTATLNSEAIIGTEGNPNEVYLEYSSDPDWDGTPGSNDEPTGETPEKEVKVYTWDMGVLKYADGNKSNVLEGVKFILLNADKTKIAKVADGKIVSWDNFTAETVIADYELGTGEDGTIHIDGLESGTYYLRETYALPGYNKLTDDITVTVDNNDDDKYETFIAEVENNSGATLPETGGMGTTLFYVFGGIMVLAAVVLLVTKKRMAAAE